MRGAPEASQVHHVQRRDVVGAAAQVVFPEALLPEAEAVHVLVVVAEGRVRERRPLHQHTAGSTLLLPHEAEASSCSPPSVTESSDDGHGLTVFHSMGS